MGSEFTPDNPSPVAIECVTCRRMTTTGMCAECAFRVEEGLARRIGEKGGQEVGRGKKRAITVMLGPLAHEWIEQEARRRRTSRSEVIRTLVQRARLGITPALGSR